MKKISIFCLILIAKIHCSDIKELTKRLEFKDAATQTDDSLEKILESEKVKVEYVLLSNYEFALERASYVDEEHDYRTNLLLNLIRIEHINNQKHKTIIKLPISEFYDSDKKEFYKPNVPFYKNKVLSMLYTNVDLKDLYKAGKDWIKCHAKRY